MRHRAAGGTALLLDVAIGQVEAATSGQGPGTVDVDSIIGRTSTRQAGSPALAFDAYTPRALLKFESTHNRRRGGQFVRPRQRGDCL